MPHDQLFLTPSVMPSLNDELFFQIMSQKHLLIFKFIFFFVKLSNEKCAEFEYQTINKSTIKYDQNCTLPNKIYFLCGLAFNDSLPENCVWLRLHSKQFTCTDMFLLTVVWNKSFHFHFLEGHRFSEVKLILTNK